MLICPSLSLESSLNAFFIVLHYSLILSVTIFSIYSSVITVLIITYELRFFSLNLSY